MLIPASDSAVGIARRELPARGLANFFAARGRQIVEACNAYWYSVSHRFLMSLPYQRFLDPTPDEIQDLLRVSGAAGVRFPGEKWGGIAGGVYVYCGRSYGLGSVHIKHRPRVRKGLQTFEIRPVDEDVLLSQGRQLNRETMSRQGHYDAEFGEAAQWARFVNAMHLCPEISAVGAFDGRHLCAYMITCREDGWLNILHQMSRQEDLRRFPNHALTYWITKAASDDLSLDGVCYGLVPLISIEGLHEYKLRFGYQVLPRTCVVVLRPSLELLFNNRIIRGGLRFLRDLRPGDQRLEMIDTILRGAAFTSCGTFSENS